MSKPDYAWIWLPGVAIALPVLEGLKANFFDFLPEFGTVAIALPVLEGLKVQGLTNIQNPNVGCDCPSGAGRVEVESWQYIVPFGLTKPG